MREPVARKGGAAGRRCRIWRLLAAAGDRRARQARPDPGLAPRPTPCRWRRAAGS